MKLLTWLVFLPLKKAGEDKCFYFFSLQQIRWHADYGDDITMGFELNIDFVEIFR